MCVIAVCRDARLSETQVKQMYEANRQGGGVAWQEFKDPETATNEYDPRIVRWKKGLLLDDMVKANQELPFPYVLHFRIPSANTSHSYLCCHPFAIDEEATSEFEGWTDSSVLFHNGHWHPWKGELRALAMASGGTVKVPDGPMSDSRALALVAHHLGRGFLGVLDNPGKIVMFGAYGSHDIQLLGDWDTLELPADENGEVKKIAVSNTSWQRTATVEVTGNPMGFCGQPNGTHRHNRSGHGANSSEVTGPTVRITEKRRMQLTERAGGTVEPDGENFRDGDAAAGSVAGDSQAHEESVSQGVQEARNGRTGTPAGAVACSAGCYSCAKQTRALEKYGDEFYCWQCWSRVTGKKPLVGQCSMCRQAASSKLTESEAWICRICWTTNGKPDAFYVTRGDKGTTQRGSVVI